MKKIVKVLVMMLLFISSFSSFSAATGSIKMTTSDWTVYVGNTFTITITATCSNGIGGVIGYLDYNTNYVSLTSTTAGDDFNKTNGKLIFDASNNTTKTYKFTFTTKKVGSTTVSFNTNEFIDYKNGDNVTGFAATVSRTMTIVQKPAPVIVKSSNSSLASLTVEGYDINFSSDVLDYQLFYEDKIESLDIKATASDSKATISSFDTTLKEGNNEIVITCTAEDGTKKDYKLTIYVQETPTIYYQFDNKKLGIVKYVNEKIKSTFESEAYIINDEEVTLYKKDEIRFLYLIDEENNKNFYIYDESKDEIISYYQPIIINNNEYLKATINYDDYQEMLELFDICQVEIDGVFVDGFSYKDENLNEFKLVYLDNEKGDIQLYRYDIVNKMVIRYVNDNPAHDYTNEAIYLGLAIAGGVMVIISLIIIVTMSKNKKVLG